MKPITLHTGDFPRDIAIDSNKTMIYVANFNGIISVIDGRINEPLTPINLCNGNIPCTDKGPIGVAVNPNTNLVYVANSLSNTVSVIDGGGANNVHPTPLTTFPPGISTSAIAVDSNLGRIYTVHKDDNSLRILPLR